MAKRVPFKIPSAQEMVNYEKEQPKIQSNFQSHKELSSSSNKRQDTLQVNCSSTSTSSTTAKQFIAQKKTLGDTRDERNTHNGLKQNSTSTVATSATTNQFTAQKKGQENTTRGNSSSENLGINQLQRIDQNNQSSNHHCPALVESSKQRVGAVSSFADKFGSLKDDAGDDSPTEIKRKKPDVEVKQPSVSSTISAAAKNKGITNCILVNPRQRGNPIIKSVRNIPWEFADIVPDYVVGRTTCVLYLSLRYHHLNPNYIHGRLKELGCSYDLRVLLVQVDVKDPHFSLKELARMAILAECTLILAWSHDEAGRYLETYKSYENKPVDALKERIDQDFVAQVTDCLTTVKSVNKTDVITLLSTFGSVKKIASADEELCLLPGFGPQKAQRLHDVFQEPFLKQS